MFGLCLGLFAAFSAPAYANPSEALVRIEFVTSEATFTHLDISPDGSRILFDTLGVLYTLPIDGGEARGLDIPSTWSFAGRYSPDGQHIAFAGIGGASAATIVARTDGSDQRVLGVMRPDEPLQPIWLGREKVVASPGQGGAPAVLFPVNRSDSRPLRLPPSPFRDAAGGSIYYLETIDDLVAVMRVSDDDAPPARIAAFERPTEGGVLTGFRVSPDGRRIAYSVQRGGRTDLVLLNLETGLSTQLGDSRESRNATPRDIRAFTFMPDGSAIVAAVNGKLQRIDIASRDWTTIPFQLRVSRVLPRPQLLPRVLQSGGEMQVTSIRWPSVGPGGQAVAFSALGKVWISRGAAEPERVSNALSGEFKPEFSPDGTKVAYITWTDEGLGGVVIASADGTRRDELPLAPGRITDIAWSADGSKLAFAENALPRIYERPGDTSVGWFDPTRGQVHRHVLQADVSQLLGSDDIDVSAAGPGSQRLYYTSETTEAYGRRWRRLKELSSMNWDGTDVRVHVRFTSTGIKQLKVSPDGKTLAFVFEEDAWVMPLRDTGEPALLDPFAGDFPGRRVSNTSVDSLDWTSDGKLVWSVGPDLFQADDALAGSEPLRKINLTATLPVPDQRLALTGLNLIDVEGRSLVADATLLLDGNVISYAGPRLEPGRLAGYREIELTGKTVMPGLVDTHGHSFLTYSNGRCDNFGAPANAAVALSFGVTTYQELGGDMPCLRSHAEMFATGQWLGPRYFYVGMIFGGEPGVDFNIASAEDAERAVARMQAWGASHLKVYYYRRSDQRRWLASAANDAAFRTTAEGENLRMDLQMITEGYDGFEHFNSDEPLYADIATFIAQSGAVVSSTYLWGVRGPWPAHMLTEAFSIPGVEDKLRSLTPPIAQVDNIDDALDQARDPAPMEYWDGLVEARNLVEIINRGGHVTFGTHARPDGLGAHFGMWGLVDAGASPIDAIRALTIEGARKLGLENHLGSVSAGKLADFIVLDANPLEDIRNTVRIGLIVQNGVIYSGNDLAEVYPEAGPAPVPFWRGGAARSPREAR